MVILLNLYDRIDYSCENDFILEMFKQRELCKKKSTDEKCAPRTHKFNNNKKKKNNVNENV